jgi:hypothetical protein
MGSSSSLKAGKCSLCFQPRDGTLDLDEITTTNDDLRGPLQHSRQRLLFGEPQINHQRQALDDSGSRSGQLDIQR